MKEAIMTDAHEKTIYFMCPYCKARIRRERSRKTKRRKYQKFCSCYNCNKRLLLIFPESKIEKKIICPLCNKNKMLSKSQVCKECYCKNPNKYRKKRRKVSENETKR